MGLTLGIDTGGTYTDAVLINEHKKIIARAKSFTTHDNLTKGISRCIDMMDITEPRDICEVHISTTLAVNSILERRFEKIGLLQIDEEIEVKPPANYTMTIRNPFRAEAAARYVDKLSDMTEIRKAFSGNVDYIVVTSPGRRNSQHYERHVADLIRRDADINVFCASEYSSADDYTERTVAAILTIYLMPVVDQWIHSVEDMMQEKGISAVLKIMNAMGELISCEQAREKPLTTLFSGLAASVKGGLALTDLKDFLLVDIGGTSSDITRIIGRQFREVKEYTKVDEFLIREKTMDVQTFGIGGDSHIKLSQLGNVTAGPQKAVPICVMCSRYPYLREELEQCRRPDNYEMLTVQDVDCFIGVRGYRHGDLTDLEKDIVEFLVDNPHNVFIISEHFKRDPDALHLDRLVKKGAVRLISITPTDVLHAEKKYTEWDAESSNTAIRHMAKQMKVSKTACIAAIKEAISGKLIRSCMQSIANFEKEQFDFEESAGAAFMLDRFYGDSSSMLEMTFRINKPIVALGAPAGTWLKQVADKLDTEVIIPEYGEVANAFGAAIAE